MTVQTIMTADKTGEELVAFAQATAKQLVKDSLNRAQIRNIFTEMRQIETMWSRDPGEALRRLNMLKPKLAYQTARSPQLRGLAQVLSEGITLVSAAREDERDDHFTRLVDLFEAILAYHRSEGGKK
jgi:CRISPR type III-A-associated protein Csm2